MPTAPHQHPYRLWLSAPERMESDWPMPLMEGALVAHLNLRGEGEITWEDGTSTLIPSRTVCWLRFPQQRLRFARRLAARDRHECLTLVYPDSWIARTFGHLQGEMSDAVRPLTQPDGQTMLRLPLSEEDEGWARGAMQPQLCLQARQILETARLTEHLVHVLFRQDNNPTGTGEVISRTMRTSQERVKRVKDALMECLESPPTLDELAVIAGCAPSHLSRTFTQMEGMTLSNWLRRARIEQAASLIASGRCNVSEASLEVGYQSFSHFSRAFSEEKGVPPSQWVKKLSGK